MHHLSIINFIFVKLRKKFIFKILILKRMKKIEFTKKEKLMLYGLVKYPQLTDNELSKKLDLKHSTVTSIRHRLKENEYLRKLIIPKLQSMGCEMLVAIYTNFSPLIPLLERVEITGKTIEEATQEIEEKLYREIVDTKFQAWLENLRKQSHIKIIEQ